LTKRERKTSHQQPNNEHEESSSVLEIQQLMAALKPLREIANGMQANTEIQKAESTGDRSFQRHSLLVQWFLFGATALAFLAAAYYASIARDANRIAQHTYETANRPYVGPSGLSEDFFSPGNDNQAIHHDSPTPDTVKIAFTASFKNFGSIPALKAEFSWEVYIDGKQAVGGPRTYSAPRTFFPTQVTNLSAFIGGEAYQRIQTNKSLLTVSSWVIYWDAGGNRYSECSRYRYAPYTASFYDLGPCEEGQNGR
jgi:hypothetical protein